MRRSYAVLPTLLLIPLAACVGSLIGGGKPAQLYQLEPTGVQDVAVPPAVGRIAVRLRPIRFAPGIDGDQILALVGQQAFYLKGARWVADAPALFRVALEHGFARQTPELLLTDEDAQQGAAWLQINVTHFEAVYAGSRTADGPPLVRIEADALLLRRGNHELIAAQHFSAIVPATANRAGVIVQAFGKACDELTAGLALWSRNTVIAR